MAGKTAMLLENSLATKLNYDLFEKVAAGYACKFINEIRLTLDHVVELGCGSGQTADVFIKHSNSYTGVDYSSQQIAGIRKKYPQYDHMYADVTKFEKPFRELIEKADLVTAVRLIQEIEDNRKLQYFANNMRKYAKRFMIIDSFPGPEGEDRIELLIGRLGSRGLRINKLDRFNVKDVEYTIMLFMRGTHV